MKTMLFALTILMYSIPLHARVPDVEGMIYGYCYSFSEQEDSLYVAHRVNEQKLYLSIFSRWGNGAEFTRKYKIPATLETYNPTGLKLKASIYEFVVGKGSTGSARGIILAAGSGYLLEGCDFFPPKMTE